MKRLIPGNIKKTRCLNSWLTASKRDEPKWSGGNRGVKISGQRSRSAAVNKKLEKKAVEWDNCIRGQLKIKKRYQKRKNYGEDRRYRKHKDGNNQSGQRYSGETWLVRQIVKNSTNVRVRIQRPGTSWLKLVTFIMEAAGERHPSDRPTSVADGWTINVTMYKIYINSTAYTLYI